MGQGLGFFAGSAAGDHAVGEADGQGFFGVDWAAGEDEVEGAAEAYEGGQADRASIEERNAPAAIEDAHDRVLLYHPQIAPQGQLQTAGHGVTGDGGDDRLAEPHACWAQRPVAIRGWEAGGPRGDRLEVGARTKGARGAPQHRDARLTVALERPEGLEQGLGRGPIDSVAPLGTGEDYRGYRALLLGRHRHPGLLQSWPQRSSLLRRHRHSWPQRSSRWPRRCQGAIRDSTSRASCASAMPMIISTTMGTKSLAVSKALA